MTTYLVHQNMEGTPIGVWRESRETFYPDESVSELPSARNLMKRQFEGESWKEFSERIASRISQRDWWDTHESEHTDIEKVWQEIDPSSAPLFD